jgi:hypothetical protein
MAEELNVDPDVLRILGDAHHATAAYLRERAEVDPEIVARLSTTTMGSVVADCLERACCYATDHRVAGWNGVADLYQGIGDGLHLSASEFDRVDVAGRDGVAKAGDEA